MRVIAISWETVESHRGKFLVPDDFDPDDWDLGNALAEYDQDTFQGCERQVLAFTNIEGHTSDHPDAVTLALEGHEVF